MTSNSGFLRDVLPEVRRAGVGTVLMSEWDAGSPGRQREVMAKVAEAWERTPLPEAFVSRVSLAGTDGRTVLNYAQWTHDAAYEEFVHSEGSGLRERVRAALGDLENPGPGRYRLYRSMLRPEERPTGCVVRVAIETPDEDAARKAVDALLELFGGEQPHPGGISSNFLISEDGTRVVNYSEWTDAASHQRVVETLNQPGTPAMSVLEGIPGVRPVGFKRFEGVRGIVRA